MTRGDLRRLFAKHDSSRNLPPPAQAHVHGPGGVEQPSACRGALAGEALGFAVAASHPLHYASVIVIVVTVPVPVCVSADRDGDRDGDRTMFVR